MKATRFKSSPRYLADAANVVFLPLEIKKLTTYSQTYQIYTKNYKTIGRAVSEHNNTCDTRILCIKKLQMLRILTATECS